MKVVRIIARLNVGGPARHVSWLARLLSEHGVSTVLVTGTVPPGEQDMSYFAAGLGVDPHIISEMSRELSWRDLSVVWKVFLLLRAVRPDVVHTHTAKAGAAGRLAAIAHNAIARLNGRPPAVIVHTYHGHVFHGYYSHWKTQFFLAVERVLAMFTDRILVLSEAQRSEIHGQYRVGRYDRYRIIPLGVDIAALDAPTLDRRAARQAFGLDMDEVAIGIVGRVVPIKNHALFVDSIRSLRERVGSTRKLRALVVGEGELLDETRNHADAMGLRDVIQFTGVQRSMTAVYSALDVLVLTSRNEGTPLAIIEAMLSGVPVVSTAVGGVPDLLGGEIADHRNESRAFSVCERGILVHRPEPEYIAASIQLTLDRPDVARRMVASALSYARTNYSVERLVSDVLGVYREALSSAEVPTSGSSSR